MTRFTLDTCVWELTLACTYSCRHCGSAAGKRRENELSTGEALSVASQLVDIGCKCVVLIGGEVFLRGDWCEIAASLTGGGVDVSIITNGSCFSERVWRQLEQAGVDYIGVSVDGMRERHDAMRAPGSFDAAMGAIASAKAHGLTVAAVTVLTSGNVCDIPRLHEELERLETDAWQLQLCSPFGNAGHFAGIVPTREVVASVIEFVSGKALEYERGECGMKVVAADNIGYFTPGEKKIRGSAGTCFRGCAAGLSVIGIDSVGNVRGCESLYDEKFTEGNLRERSLQSIWDDPDSFSYNRRFHTGLLEGECSGCDKGRLCAAGCRSMNHFLTGNMYRSGTCARFV